MGKRTETLSLHHEALPIRFSPVFIEYNNMIDVKARYKKDGLIGREVGTPPSKQKQDVPPNYRFTGYHLIVAWNMKVVYR